MLLCSGEDSRILPSLGQLCPDICACASLSQSHCCTPGKDWFSKPDLLPEQALGQLLWIYGLSWVILFLLTDEMFRQTMGLRNLCTSGPVDEQRLWQQHQLCSPEGENELQLEREMLCLQWPMWHMPAHGQC